MFRVSGQAMQAWMPVTFLPSFEEWQGSRLPYPLLLAAQVAILALFVWVATRMWRGRPVVGWRWARATIAVGAAYFAVMATRLVLGLTVLPESAWFAAPISAAFHLVLAAAVLLIGLHAARQAEPGSDHGRPERRQR